MTSLAGSATTQAVELLFIRQWDQSLWAHAAPGGSKKATAEAARIAIVDDDRWMRDSLERLLTSAGFRAESFVSAEQFLDGGGHDADGCVILDIRLPGMSGLELGRQLAADHHRVPVVFISAHDEPQVRHEAAQTGAIAFLGKPFDDVELLTAVHRALRLTKGET
jgi:FixJ family two-component response regulator